MDTNRPLNHQNDEIDLFELIQTIWNGKRWVMLLTILCGALGIAYVLITPKIYEVKVQLYLHPDADVKLLEFFDQQTNNRWYLDTKSRFLTFTTSQLSEPEIYRNELELSAAAAIGQMALIKKMELEEISTLHPALLGTEEIAKVSIANRRFLKIVDNPDTLPIHFGAPITKVKSPRTGFTLGLTGILGCMIGIASVLMKEAYRAYVNKRTS